MYARCNESSGGPVDVASAVVIAWSIEDGIGYPVTAAPFHDAVAASGYTICDLDIYVAFENTSVGIQRVTPAAHALQCANTAAPNDPSAAPQDAHPTPAPASRAPESRVFKVVNTKLTTDAHTSIEVTLHAQDESHRKMVLRFQRNHENKREQRVWDALLGEFIRRCDLSEIHATEVLHNRELLLYDCGDLLLHSTMEAVANAMQVNPYHYNEVTERFDKYEVLEDV
jgi:hypothetical protein